MRAFTVPDLVNHPGPQDEVHLTRGLNLVCFHQRRRTLSVLTIEKFTEHFADTPVGWSSRSCSMTSEPMLV